MKKSVKSVKKTVGKVLWPSDKHELGGKLKIAPTANYYYYEQYGMRHMVRLEYENEKLNLYSLSDHEYIETIPFSEIIGCSLLQPSENEIILMIHLCSQYGNQPRSYRKLVFQSVKGEFIQPTWYHHLKNQLKTSRLLVVVNPSGGSKHSLIEYNTRIRPLFSAASCPCETYVTKCPKDATHYFRQVDLNSFDKIVVFGGDGTVSEVINGLRQHPEAEQALKKQIGIIPTGSGNGLVRSILHESGEPFSTLGAAFRLLKHPGVEMPLVKNIIHTPDGDQTMYSFLATAWGMPSDVDIESEFYRFLGSIRFTLGTIIRLVNLKSYHGRIRILPAEEKNLDDLQKFQDSLQLTNNWVTVATPEDEIVLFWGCNAPYVAEDMLVAPSMTLATQHMSLILVKQPISRYELISMFMSLEQGNHINHEKIISHYAYAFQIEPDISEQGHMTIDGELVDYRRISSMISPLKVVI